MNFLHYISSSNYINLNFKFSYKKCIYSIQLITLLFLIALPYTYNTTFIILMFFIQIILIIVFRNLYLIKFLTLYKKILFFSLNTIVFNYFTNDNQYADIFIRYLFILYFFKIVLLSSVTTFIFKLSAYYIVYKIPEYIRKIIVLNILYIIICYNISIFIKSERINKALYIGYTSIIKFKIHIYNAMIINILISSQILEKIIGRINSLYLGIKVKSKTNKKEMITYIALCNKKLLDQILKDQNNLNITLWNRSVHNKFKHKIYID
uniref:hypothetical protein orf264 n=1 Tax=Xiphosiphonia pinnulata TaxID=2305477 RepID=UPI0022FD7C4A|nr:hypothetical protein orf264 [Xiphosiphonia pinnulata]WAX03468.1 hypothetical protein orf264 [Xiphosiphonia pinnulata]